MPVPEPVTGGEPTAEYPVPWAVCRWVPGSPPHGPEAFDGDETARRLGQFVHARHDLDTRGGPVADERTQRAGSLASFDAATRGALGCGCASRVVVDPNVLVAAAITDGVSARLLDHWLTTPSLEIVACPMLIAELHDVLGRDRFRRRIPTMWSRGPSA